MLQLLAALLTLGLACAAAAEPSPLPRPPQLEPNVRFWTRIYTEVGSGSGLIHDSRDLEVVYARIDLPEGLGPSGQERHVERIKKRYRAALRSLAQGKRQGLSAEERRVLAAWPEGTRNTTLRDAALRVRFQLGQADRFREGLIRSGRWSRHIAEMLEQHGVPGELVALPHVESSFNPSAYSRVGAAGLWQFTRSTGRRYMRVDHVVDERMDPYRATEGAARLLRDNHRRLETWPLAITAYNHGVAGIARAVRHTGTNDLGVIAERYTGRTFGFASRNFYAEFLAASDIHQNAERYFGALPYQTPNDYEVVVTDHYYSVVSLERALGVDHETLRLHNPALRPAVWNGAKRVPRGYPLRLPAGALQQPAETLLASIPSSERAPRQTRDRYHTVRRGETLSRIAARYAVSERELVALNNLRSRHRIRAGQILRLPQDDQATIVVARVDPPVDGIYQVRRGDSLTVISARFGIPLEDLVAWNQLRNRHRLAIGQRLRLTPPLTQLASNEPLAGAAQLAAAPPPTPQPQAPLASELHAVVPAVGVESAVLHQPDGPAPGEPAGEHAAASDASEPQAPAAEVPEDMASEMASLEIAPLEAAPLPVASESAEDEIPPSAHVVAALKVEEVSVPDPSNYAVTRDQRITVQAEETLGHYAEWLEVSASRLRQLNGMRYGTPLVIGRQKKLDFSRVTPEVFEARRLAYHRTLQEEFFNAFAVSGTRTHLLRRGESLWYLANKKYEVPMWLLRQYNPDLDFGALPAGTPMVIPLIEPRAQPS